MEKFLEEQIKKSKSWVEQGKVASYIPELKDTPVHHLGVAIKTQEGKMYCAGDADIAFTIQSVSKPLVLILALMDNGEKAVFEKIGMEPTGDPFNSMVRLETFQRHKPYNPMINAGAIAMASMIKGKNLVEKKQRIHNFFQNLCPDQAVGFNEAVYLSEKRTGHRNRAMAYFMKEFGIIENDVETCLDTYFYQCALETTAKGLANMGWVLAMDGKSPNGKNQIIPRRYARIAKAFMVTCGMYDGSGEFAMNVGIPAKSGVGGGILCAVPKKMGIGVYGPSLDEKGNPVAGIQILKALSEAFDLSVF